jgi:hypothetical protein
MTDLRLHIRFVPALFLVLLLLPATPTMSAAVSETYNLSPKADPSARYLFYLPGWYVEARGTQGDYDYHGVAQAFGEMGFTVVSTPDGFGAAEVKKEIERLLTAGVPAKSIAVVGHSKGAFTTMMVSARLENPDITYVVMAGCFWTSPPPSPLHGRVLSIYDASDQLAGSCEKAFANPPQDLESKEVVLQTEEGHRLFYHARGEWLVPVKAWLDGGE